MPEETFFSELSKYNLNKQLVDYISKYVFPYYNGFDAAHGMQHVSTVIVKALKLSGYYDVDKNMIFTIAAYHDAGQIYGREKHHIESGRLIMEDSRLREWFTEEDIAIMKEAAEDHRASISYEPRTIYGKIVAEADRDLDPKDTLLRIVQYGLHNNQGHTREWHYERFLQHIKEKYAEGGYMKLWIPESDNKYQLQKIRSIISDKKLLKETFNRMYDNEISSVKNS